MEDKVREGGRKRKRKKRRRWGRCRRRQGRRMLREKRLVEVREECGI